MKTWALSGPASLDVATYKKIVLGKTELFMTKLAGSPFARGLPKRVPLQDPSIQKIFKNIITQGFSEDTSSEAAMQCYYSGFLHKELKTKLLKDKEHMMNPSELEAECLVFPSPLHRW